MQNFHTGSVKKVVVKTTILWKMTKSATAMKVRPVCSAISSHSALRSSTDHHRKRWCWMCSLRTCQCTLRKDCLRLDLLDCEDILLCCSGGTDLGFFGLSGCTWLTTRDSRHFSLSLQRWWMVAIGAFQIFMTAQLCNEVWPKVYLEKSSNTGLFNGVIRNLLLVCVVEFDCSKASLRKLPISFFPRGLSRYHTLSFSFRWCFMAR